MDSKPLVILVSGPRGRAPEDLANAEEVGRLLALSGATVLTGGGAGSWRPRAAAPEKRAGETLAILPGSDARTPRRTPT